MNKHIIGSILDRIDGIVDDIKDLEAADAERSRAIKEEASRAKRFQQEGY